MEDPAKKQIESSDNNRKFDINAATAVLLILLLVVWPLLSVTLVTPGLQDADQLDVDMTVNIYLPTIVLQLLIFAAVYSVTRLERSNLRSLWFNRITLDKVFIGLAFFIAAGLILSILAILVDFLDFGSFDDPSHLLPTDTAGRIVWVILCLIVAVSEEAAFRGYALTRLSAIIRSRYAAAVLVSLSFSLGHFYQGFGGVIVIFVYGLMFAALFFKTGSIWPGIIAHFFQDFTPMLVSDYLRGMNP